MKLPTISELTKLGTGDIICYKASPWARWMVYALDGPDNYPLIIRCNGMKTETLMLTSFNGWSIISKVRDRHVY